MERATGEGHSMEVYVPAIAIGKKSKSPLHVQIQRQIAEEIRSGAIQGAMRLPSTRVLAAMLGVSRNTVLTAYENLSADGLIDSCRGVGMRVNGRAAPPTTMLSGLRQAIRASNYPEKILMIADPDGNAFYVNDRRSASRLR
jgi:DNA-binding transcriptional regulator YhcF (GntR family)